MSSNKVFGRKHNKCILCLMSCGRSKLHQYWERTCNWMAAWSPDMCWYVWIYLCSV